MNNVPRAAVLAALGIALPVAGHADGAALFEQNCTACHAAGGVGTPPGQVWPALGTLAALA